MARHIPERAQRLRCQKVVASADQDMGVVGRLGDEFGDERAFANAGLATHQDDAPTRRIEIVEKLTQLRQFGVAPQEHVTIITGSPPLGRFDHPTVDRPTLGQTSEIN
jgi:hypothetical protein